MIAEAESLYPHFKYTVWWYKLYEKKGWLSPKAIMIFTFLIVNGVAIFTNETEMLRLRNIALIVANSPLVLVVISGAIAISLKNIKIRKRAKWLGVSLYEYNEYMFG